MQNRQINHVIFQKQLFLWYHSHHRNLPWRNTREPYKIWISEVMLQQTTVQAVIPYYENWIKLFPDIRTLSQAPLQQVLKAWQGLGYYQRARNLHAAAKILVKHHKAEIPKDYGMLIKLPGFGPYTSSAVLSIAYGMSFPVIDANVRRICMRLMRLKGKTTSQTDMAVKKFLNEHLVQKKIGIFNQAMMELGALLCRSKNPSCLLCPVSEFCKAFASGEQEIIPSPRKREYKRIEAVIALIKKGDKYLIQKRPSRGLLAGLWEFPGGKKKTGESLEQALRREIQEELGTQVKHLRFLTHVQHAYTHFQVKLSAFSCRLQSEPELSRRNFRWVTLQEMRHYPFPSGSAKIIKYLEKPGL